MKSIWDILSIDDYLKIKNDDLDLLVKIVVSNCNTEEQAIKLINSIKDKPENKEYEIKLNTKQFVDMMYLIGDIDNNLELIIKEFKLSGLAKDVLNYISSVVKYINDLLEEYKVLFNKEEMKEEDSPDFDDNSFSKDFGWYALLESVCDCFNVSLFELYNIDCDEFLGYVFYIQEKNKYDKQKIEQYKNK